MNRILTIIIFIGLFSTQTLFACEEDVVCEKCAKKSEFSWNPNNEYVTERLDRFYELDDQITEAFIINDDDSAKSLIAEYLELADIYRCNWNYGNAIHDANRMLGLISLKNGNIDEAAGYLLKSGKSTGSPQLDTFGPELNLANELLKLGRTEEVLIYLNDIKSFWERNDDQINQWIGKIENDEKPEINRFQSHRGFWQLLIFWISVLWPVLITAIFLLTLRSKIYKKWFFGIASIVTGYTTMLAVNYLLIFMLPIMLSKLAQNENGSLLTLAVYALMSAVYIVPLIVIFILSRYFVARDT